MVYYHFYGFVNLFSDIEYSSIGIFKGVFLNFISVLGTILVIQFMPDKKVPIPPKFNHSFKFYIASLLFLLMALVLSGGYEEALNGSLDSTAIKYVLLFFSASTALTLFLYLQKKIKFAGVAVLLYVIVSTIAGSRSGIIIVLIISLILPMFQNNNVIKKKLRVFVIFFCIVSPALFYYATSVREVVDESVLSKLIVGRVSMIELASIPIDAKENNRMDVKLYDEKYGFINQFKQCINEISPLDPFKYDISPNQYHRAIFYGNSELSVLDHYMSMNITLPTYFYLQTNLFFGCLFSIFFLSLLYYIWIVNSDNLYLLIGIIMSLYYILQYFDWVMLTSGFFKICLTIFALKWFDKFFNILFSSNVTGKTEIIKNEGLTV